MGQAESWAAAVSAADDTAGAEEGSSRGRRAIRRRLIRVATDLFVRQGYRATTTKQICASARTTERTLFRNFGSKAGLFEATVAEPFSEFVQRWLASFGQVPPETALDEQIHAFVRALVDFLGENRDLLRMLMAAEVEEEDSLSAVVTTTSATFAAGLHVLAQDAGRDLMRVRDYRVADAGLSIAAGVSMALGMVLMDRWVFAHDAPRPDREAIVHEVSQMILYGISGRPEGA
jgi:AcrR family transcriptional regulator